MMIEIEARGNNWRGNEPENFEIYVKKKRKEKNRKILLVKLSNFYWPVNSWLNFEIGLCRKLDVTNVVLLKHFFQ